MALAGCSGDIMDNIEVVGEEIWFRHYKLGARPPGMCATQWDQAVWAITCPEPDPELLEAEYERGRDWGVESIMNADSRQLAKLKLLLARKLEKEDSP